MFNRKYKETIKELNEEKKYLLERTNDLCENIVELEKKLEDKEIEFYKDYRYAILVKDYNDIKVWNDGRFEKGIRGISLECSVPNLPEIEIRK